MASTRFAALARLAACNAVADLFDSTTFTIEIRSGAQPSDVDGADVGDLLATFTGPTAPAFGAASDDGSTATATAGVIATVNGSATGTAGHARVKRAGTIVADHDVGLTGSGAAVTLSSLGVTSGQPVSLTSYTHSQPTGT